MQLAEKHSWFLDSNRGLLMLLANDLQFDSLPHRIATQSL